MRRIPFMGTMGIRIREMRAFKDQWQHDACSIYSGGGGGR